MAAPTSGCRCCCSSVRSGCGNARTSSRRRWDSCSAWPPRSTALPSPCGGRSPAARRWAWAPAIGVPVARIHRAPLDRRDGPGIAASPSPAWRTRRYARDARGGARRSPCRSAASWPLALGCARPAHLHAWWAAQSLGDFLAPLDPAASGDAMFLLKNLPWFAWPALPLVIWTLVTRGRGFNGGLATPGVQLPGDGRRRRSVVCLLAMAEPRLIHLMPLLLPLSLLGRAGDRHAEARLFRRARLVRHSHLRPPLAAHVVAVVRRLGARHGAGRRPDVPRHRGRLPAARSIGSPSACRLFLTLLWLALVRPARRSNRRAVLNWAAGMTLLWALYSTIWLPYLDSRRSYRAVAESLRARAAARRLRGQPEPGRSAAGAVPLFREPRDRARGDVGRSTDCTRCWSSTAAHDGVPAPPRGWEIGVDGRTAAATTPSATSSTCGSQREIHRRSLHRGDRRRRRQRRRRRSGGRSTSRAADRTAATAAAAAASGRRRPQHQHADRLPLRAHPPRQARRERPRRRPVRPAAPRTSSCASRWAP